jgi:hypothetical protein
VLDVTYEPQGPPPCPGRRHSRALELHQDTPETLDYRRIAGVVDGIMSAISR